MWPPEIGVAPYYEDEAVVIYHGDCRDILPSLPKVDLVLTDPPYGIGHASSRAGKFNAQAIHGDGNADLRDEVLGWWGNQSALVFGNWKTTPPDGTRTALVWDKGPASGMGDLRIPWKCSWEVIYVLGEGFKGHRGEGVLRGHRVVTWSGKLGQRTHPTEKPVSLLVALLEKCPFSTVLDPFMGTGATLLAAAQTGRKAIGIEIEERYCEIAAKRMSQTVMAL